MERYRLNLIQNKKGKINIVSWQLSITVERENKSELSLAALFADI
jgi:hypothetical protein